MFNSLISYHRQNGWIINLYNKHHISFVKCIGEITYMKEYEIENTNYYLICAETIINKINSLQRDLFYERIIYYRNGLICHYILKKNNMLFDKEYCYDIDGNIIEIINHDQI